MISNFKNILKGIHLYEILGLGGGRVIEGWDEGIALLSVGSKAKFIVTPDLGYGPMGLRPNIPPNATLILNVELLDKR